MGNTVAAVITCTLEARLLWGTCVGRILSSLRIFLSSSQSNIFDKMRAFFASDDLPGTAKKSAEPCSTELASVVGAFLPFLLQRLRRDLLMPTQDDDKHNSASGAAPDSPTADIIATLFGCGIRTTSTCVAKGHTATSDVLTRFVVKLRSGDDEKTNLDTQDCTLRVNDTTPLYPLSLSGKSYFGTLLENSLARTFLRATFCKGCGTPTLQKHKESVMCFVYLVGFGQKAHFFRFFVFASR